MGTGLQEAPGSCRGQVGGSLDCLPWFPQHMPLLAVLYVGKGVTSSPQTELLDVGLRCHGQPSWSLQTGPELLADYSFQDFNIGNPCFRLLFILQLGKVGGTYRGHVVYEEDCWNQ